MSDTIAALQDEFHGIQNSHQDLQNKLDESAPKDAQSIAGALNLGLARLYQLAVFVRGDYDTRAAEADDTPQKKDLLDKVSDSFDALYNTSMSSLKKVAQLHSQDVELQSTRLDPFRQKVSQAVTDTEIRVKGLSQNLEQAQQAVNNAQNSLNISESSLHDLEGKLANAEKEESSLNTTLSILVPWWGIAGLINPDASPGHVLLQHQVDDMRNSVSSAQNTLSSSNFALTQATMQKTQVDNELQAQRAIAAQLPVLSSAMDATTDRMDKLQKAMISITNSATKITERMGQMSNAALITAHTSFSKHEFISGILDLCELALMEPGSAKEIKAITDEVQTGYSGTVPKDLKSTLDDLNGGVAQLVV